MSKSKFERKFVLKQVFEDAKGMCDGENRDGKTEHHFGFPWRTVIIRKGSVLIAFLECPHDDPSKQWEIKTDVSVKMTTAGGTRGGFKAVRVFSQTNKLIECEGAWVLFGTAEKDKDVLIDAIVRIVEMPNMAKKRSREFDESQSDVSDVILNVQDQKFYVSKLTLASHSPYFKVLLRGEFKESTQPEIELKDIDAAGFQDFLEIVYGDGVVTDENVEKVLLIAEMCDTPMVRRKCEEFLMSGDSKMVTRDKISLSGKFRLTNLLAHSVDRIKTMHEMEFVSPFVIEEANPIVMAAILQRTFEIANPTRNALPLLTQAPAPAQDPVLAPAEAPAPAPFLDPYRDLYRDNFYRHFPPQRRGRGHAPAQDPAPQAEAPAPAPDPAEAPAGPRRSARL